MVTANYRVNSQVSGPVCLHKSHTQESGLAAHLTCLRKSRCSIRRCLATVAWVHISLFTFHNSSFWQSCNLHTTCLSSSNIWDLAVVLVVKNLPASAGDIRDMGLIPRSGRSPGEGHGNPLQYSFLENFIDRGAWWAIVHWVAKSPTCLKRLRTHL